MSTEISKIIRNFVVDNFLFGESGDLEDDTPFLEGGIVDSTGILELVDFVENAFTLSVRDEEIIPENFGSIRQLESFLTRRLCRETRGEDPSACVGAGA